MEKVALICSLMNILKYLRSKQWSVFTKPAKKILLAMSARNFLTLNKPLSAKYLKQVVSMEPNTIQSPMSLIHHKLNQPMRIMLYLKVKNSIWTEDTEKLVVFVN